MAPLLLLVPHSLTPVLLGRAGLLYFATALGLGAMFLYRADQLATRRSNAMARRLLLASIVYLPLIFILLVLGGDRPPGPCTGVNTSERSCASADVVWSRKARARVIRLWQRVCPWCGEGDYA